MRRFELIWNFVELAQRLAYDLDVQDAHMFL